MDFRQTLRSSELHAHRQFSWPHCENHSWNCVYLTNSSSLALQLGTKRLMRILCYSCIVDDGSVWLFILLWSWILTPLPSYVSTRSSREGDLGSVYGYQWRRPSWLQYWLHRSRRWPVGTIRRSIPPGKRSTFSFLINFSLYSHTSDGSAESRILSRVPAIWGSESHHSVQRCPPPGYWRDMNLEMHNLWGIKVTSEFGVWEIISDINIADFRIFSRIYGIQYSGYEYTNAVLCLWWLCGHLSTSPSHFPSSPANLWRTKPTYGSKSIPFFVDERLSPSFLNIPTKSTQPVFIKSSYLFTILYQTSISSSLDER